MKKSADFLSSEHDPRDPSPWRAVYLDRSIPISEEVKRAWLQDSASRSRQFLLPIVRPLARAAIILIQLLRTILPSAFASSRVLHNILAWSLRRFVSPTANWLILRHFNLGAEILAFVAANAGDVKIPPLSNMRIKRLEEIRDHVFLKHDLNEQLRQQDRQLETVARPDFSMVDAVPLEIEDMPRGWSNVIDLHTAIEMYTPVYQLFLSDNDFWRATHSLQLDESIAIYVSTILGDPRPFMLCNNKHPLVPESTLRSGYRLVLHGLSTEMLHAYLVEKKQEQARAGT